MSDLNRLPLESLTDALSADRFVVFGATYIKGPLCDALVECGALNIHMGISPYYRGSSTNFWAMYDNRPDLVGATIHLLSRGLDSGPMLFHALPPANTVDPFVHGMRAVKSAHIALANYLQRAEEFDPVAQDASKELRYTRNRDFTDEVAAEYLGRLPTPQRMGGALQGRDMTLFLRPQIVQK